MARISLGKWMISTLLLTSVSSCGLLGPQKSGGDSQSTASANSVLPIAPYQNSAITLVSPDGKNTKAATFQRFTGELTMKKDMPSSVKFSVQTNSVATSDKKLVSVLQDKNLFNSAKYPTADFQSTEIKKNTAPGALPNQYVVDGNLDIRGEKIKMSVPANMEISDKEVSMMIQLSISQKDWMDKLSTSPDAFFKDHMDVVAKLVFPKPVKETPAALPATTPAPSAADVKKTPVAAAPKELPAKAAAPAKSSDKQTTENKGK